MHQFAAKKISEFGIFTVRQFGLLPKSNLSKMFYQIWALHTGAVEDIIIARLAILS